MLFKDDRTLLKCTAGLLRHCWDQQQAKACLEICWAMCSPRFPRYGSYDWQGIFGLSKRFSWKNPAREVCKTLHEPTLEREQLDGTLKHQRSHGVSKNNHLTLFFSASYLDPLVLVAKLQLQFYGELDVFRKIRTLPQQKESSKKHTSFRCKSRC